jgi:4-amino-4-deoxy-L-arabinose transferase-like glycosyltransferase
VTLARALAGRACTALRRAAAGIPRAAYLCALVGVMNALVWSVITPPFEVPDENAHYAYVAQLAETASLPRYRATYVGLSPAEDAILADTKAFQIPGESANPAPLTQTEQRAIEATEAAHLSARGSGDALSASANPPLYYLLEVVPYELSPSGTVLDRLALMRALSAIFAGLTVLFVFLFLRELLPGTRWAWPVGALAVALQPLFAFISGGVNNDALLYTFAAATFFTVARMFRRGLNEWTGLAIGVVLGLGLLVKFTILGFAPALALALLCGIWRAGRVGRRASLRGAALAVGVAAIPALLYVKLLARTLPPSSVGPGTRSAVLGVPTGLRVEVERIWELFLPTLPGMGNRFHVSEFWHEWFLGLVGRFGWLDTRFPSWVYLVAAPICAALVLAALAALVRERGRVWRRADELAVYVAMIAGLCIEIGVESYETQISGGGVFEQPRYLLSGLCIYAAVVALATRLPGRRWGLAVGALIVTLALAHDVFSQLLVIARYYA